MDSMRTGYIGTGGAGYGDATTPQAALRDKTQTEVMIARLQAAAQRMATHNDIAGMSLDRLMGGELQKAGIGRVEQPAPVDFVSHATLLLDRIGGELERMEVNAGRLARLA